MGDRGGWSLESLVARALEPVLRRWLLGFRREQLRLNGLACELFGLELNAAELHTALGLPQGLIVRHARVDSLRVQLPGLANYKTEPWVVHLGALEVAVQEVPFGACAPKPPPPPPPEPGGYSVTEKIADGASILIDSVRLTVELLGSGERAPAAAAGAAADAAGASQPPPAWHPPLVVLEARGLQLVTTDAAWRVVDLSAARAFNARVSAAAAAAAAAADGGAAPGAGHGAVYVFRMLTWQALTLTLAPHPRCDAAAASEAVQVVQRLDGCARITAAKAAALARTAMEIDIQLRDAVVPELNRSSFTAAVRLVVALRDSLARPDFWEAATEVVQQQQQQQQQAAGAAAFPSAPRAAPPSPVGAGPQQQAFEQQPRSPLAPPAALFPAPPSALPPPLAAFPSAPLAPPPPPPPRVRVLLRLALPRLLLRVRDDSPDGQGHRTEAFIRGLSLQHVSGAAESPLSAALRLEVEAVLLRDPSVSPPVTLLQPAAERRGPPACPELPPPPPFASARALRRVYPLPPQRQPAASSSPPPADPNEPPPPPMLALYMYTHYPPPPPPAIAYATHVHVWRAQSELEVAALQRLVRLFGAAMHAAPTAPVAAADGGNVAQEPAAWRSRLEVHIAEGTLLALLPPAGGEGGAERLRVSLRGGALAVDPSLPPRVLRLGPAAAAAASAAAGARGALRFAALEATLEAAAAPAWRLLTADAGRAEVIAAPASPQHASPPLLGVAVTLGGVRARLSAAQARRGAAALRSAAAALRAIAGLDNGDAAATSSMAAAAAGFWRGVGSALETGLLLAPAPPAMHFLLSLGHAQAALSEAPGWRAGCGGHGRVLARAALCGLRAEARCGAAAAEVEAEADAELQADAPAAPPLALLAVTCEAATLDTLPQAAPAEVAAAAAEAAAVSASDDGNASDASDGAPATDGLQRLIGPRWGAAPPAPPPPGSGTAAAAAAAADAAAAAPSAADRGRLLLDAAVTLRRRPPPPDTQPHPLPVALAARARLANCDIALSLGDALSVAERFWPAVEWDQARNAVGAEAAAAAAALAAVAELAAAPAGAVSELGGVSAAAAEGFWALLRDAETRGGSYDVSAEVADWCLRWAPLNGAATTAAPASAPPPGVPLAIGLLRFARRSAGAAPGAGGELELRAEGVRSLVRDSPRPARTQRAGSGSGSGSESGYESDEEDPLPSPAQSRSALDTASASEAEEPPPPPPSDPSSPAAPDCEPASPASPPEASEQPQPHAPEPSTPPPPPSLPVDVPSTAAPPAAASSSPSPSPRSRSALEAWIAEDDDDSSDSDREQRRIAAAVGSAAVPTESMPAAAEESASLQPSSAAHDAAAVQASAKTTMWELLNSETESRKLSDEELLWIGGAGAEQAQPRRAGPVRVLPRTPSAPPVQQQPQPATPPPAAPQPSLIAAFPAAARLAVHAASPQLPQSPRAPTQLPPRPAPGALPLPPPPPQANALPPLPARHAAPPAPPAPPPRQGLSARLDLGQRTPGGPWALRLLELGDASGPALRLSNSDLVGIAALARAEAAALRRMGARWPAASAALAPLLARLEAPRLAAWATLAAAEVEAAAEAAAAEEAERGPVAGSDGDAAGASPAAAAAPPRRRRRRRAAAAPPALQLGDAAAAELAAALAALRAAAGAAAPAAAPPPPPAGVVAPVPRSPLSALPARGELLKRGSKWPFQWEARYFVLTWRQLCYFKARGARAPLALLELPPGGGARAVEPTAAEGRAAAFAIASANGEELLVAAASEIARDRWLAAFALAGGGAAAPPAAPQPDVARLQHALARVEAAAAAMQQPRG